MVQPTREVSSGVLNELASLEGARSENGDSVTLETSLKWSKRNYDLALSSNGQVVTKINKDGYAAARACWALGTSLNKNTSSRNAGRPTSMGLQEMISFRMVIKSSWKNKGTGIVVGVTDATTNFTGTSGGRVWGLSLWTGKLYTADDAYRSGSLGKPLMDGSLQGNAEGAVIRVFVEPLRNTLMFSTNSGEIFDAQVTLSATVSPWVLLYHEDDAVLTAIKGLAIHWLL